MLKKLTDYFLSYFKKVDKGISFNTTGLSKEEIKKYILKESFYTLRTDTGVWELKGIEEIKGQYYYIFYIIDSDKYIEISHALFEILFEPTKYNPLNIDSFIKRDRNVSQ